MGALKRTVLYNHHVGAGAKMVDFGGWEMPVNYPGGMIEEHLYTRKKVGIFDISHMGRFAVSGREAKEFLQVVLTNDVLALDLLKAQYTFLSNASGGAIDDAYLYRFYDEEYLLVVNASNLEKDWDHLNREIKKFDAQLVDRSEELAMIAVQGPESQNVINRIMGTTTLTEPVRNALGILHFGGREVLISRTGYTGEPLGYELMVKAADAAKIWEGLIALGAMAIGLGARDTLRLEAGLPLYGHELGLDIDGGEIPIFSCPMAKFAVKFVKAKGDFIGRKALEKQYEGVKRVVRPIVLTDKGVARAGYKVFKGDREVGYVTSGTMIPYLKREGEGPESKITEEKVMRAIGLALLDREVELAEEVEVEIRGNRAKAVVMSHHKFESESRRK